METQELKTENAVTDLEIPEKGEWDFTRHQKYLNEIGKRYPREFLENMSDMAFDLVLNWMHKTNAPQEIIDLMDDGYVLIIETRTGPNWIDYEKHDLSEIPEMVSRITKMIYENGGYLEAGKLIIRETNSVGER